MKDNKIAFDFDGVIANTTKMKIKWFKKRNIKIKTSDKTSIYNILGTNMDKNRIDEIYKKMSKDIFTKEVLDKTKPVRGAVRILKKLSKQYEIYIITARPEKMFPDIESWLKKYNIEKDITKVISSTGKEKQDICNENNIFLLCDDDIRHLTNKKIQVRMLFKNNKKIRDDDIISLNTWRRVKIELERNRRKSKSKSRIL